MSGFRPSDRAERIGCALLGCAAVLVLILLFVCLVAGTAVLTEWLAWQFVEWLAGNPG